MTSYTDANGSTITVDINRERHATIVAPYPLKGLRDWQAEEIAKAVAAALEAPAYQIVKLSGRFYVVGEDASYASVDHLLSARHGVSITRVQG